MTFMVMNGGVAPLGTSPDDSRQVPLGQQPVLAHSAFLYRLADGDIGQQQKNEDCKATTGLPVWDTD